jgi:hypothetical protein
MHNQWDVELSFEEDGTHTMCEARLMGERAPGLIGHGDSERSAVDRPVPRIGEEVAAARALEQLSHKLRAQASGDIEDEARRPIYLIY